MTAFLVGVRRGTSGTRSKKPLMYWRDVLFITRISTQIYFNHHIRIYIQVTDHSYKFSVIVRVFSMNGERQKTISNRAQS